MLINREPGEPGKLEEELMDKLKDNDEVTRMTVYALCKMAPTQIKRSELEKYFKEYEEKYRRKS